MTPEEHRAYELIHELVVNDEYTIEEAEQECLGFLTYELHMEHGYAAFLAGRIARIVTEELAQPA